ncbi:MAG: DUF2586 family protein [Flammeovirgaceae bacterium]
MALPNVKITQLNGQLGTLPPNEDGVAGLLVRTSETLPAGVTAQTAYLLRSTADASDLGIDGFAFQHISDFYRQAPVNAALYVSFLTNTDAPTVADAIDSSGSGSDFAGAFMDQAEGKIKLLGVVSDITDTTTTALAAGITNAVVKAKEFTGNQAAEFRYVSVLLEAKTPDGLIADLPNLRSNEANRVSVMTGADTTTAGDNTSIGLLLGRLAADPVNRNPGRVKSGAVLTVNAGFSNGNPLTDYREGDFVTLNDKGYIFFRAHDGLNGFYFNDDHTATVTTDDFAGISSGRTIDKSSRIAKRIYTNELLDEVDLNDDGTMRPSVIAYFQSVLQNAIAGEMANEISNVIVFADPTQNVAQTNEINVTMSITRKGQAKAINVTIGFTAPGTA